MKQILFALLAACILCCSCSVTLQNAFLGHNYSNENLNLRLQSENYRVIGTVTGSATATYICDFGGLSDKAKKIFASSYNDMVEKAELKPNQAIINVITEKRVNPYFYPIYSRQVVHTTGTIIEFGEGNSDVPQQTEEIKTPVKQSGEQIAEQPVEINIPLSLYRVYTDSDGDKAIIVELSDDNKHGKAIKTFAKLRSYNTALSKCKKLGTGWRMATESEVLSIWKKKDVINEALSIENFPTISPKYNYWCFSTQPTTIDLNTLQTTIRGDVSIMFDFIAILDF